MIPTSKDLKIGQWKKQWTNSGEHWLLHLNRKAVGNIYTDPYGKDIVHVKAFLPGGGTESIEIGTTKPFDINDFKPFWERMMDRVLLKMFKL